MRLKWAEPWVVWLAQGFGAGRFPIAPGTAGSLVGVLWFFFLLQFPRWAGLVVAVAGVLAAVAVCQWAELLMGERDSPRMVLDEIVAVPFCFLAWMMMGGPGDSTPGPEMFLAERTWYKTMLVVVLFRLFDIWKPWPVRGLQKLPGGWGVVSDDLMAAVQVNLVWSLFHLAAGGR